MKKIIQTVSLAALVAVTSISSASAEAFKGFYIGAEAGWQQNRFEIKTPFGKGKAHKNGVVLGGNLGLSTVASNGVYLAGELDFNFNIADHRTTFMPGAFAKIGYRFTPNFVLAAKAGMTYNKATGHHRHDKSRWGFAPGAEALYAVNEHNIVGLSYQYTILEKSHYGPFKLKPTSHAVSVKYAYKF